MDDPSDPRAELISRTRHGVALSRDNADLNRRMTEMYAARAPGVKALPSELLREYASVLHEEAASCEALADAMQAEIAGR